MGTRRFKVRPSPAGKRVYMYVIDWIIGDWTTKCSCSGCDLTLEGSIRHTVDESQLSMVGTNELQRKG